MKKTIHNIVLSEKENKLVIAALLASNEGLCSKADKNKMWKHLVANIQYLNLEYTIINLYHDDSTDIPAFLILHELNDNTLIDKLTELETEYSILAFTTLDTTKVNGNRLMVNFDNRDCTYYIQLDDLVEKPYNYYETYNYLGKMGVANGAKKKWQQMLV